MQEIKYIHDSVIKSLDKRGQTDGGVSGEDFRIYIEGCRVV